LLLDSSGIWHQVEIDDNPDDGIPGVIYDINLTTTGVIEDLRGHPLTASDFDQGVVTSIWITDDLGQDIQNATLAERILTTAQNAAILKDFDLYDSIDGHINPSDLVGPVTGNDFTYYCYPGHDGLIFLTVGMNDYAKRKSYYFNVISDLILQPSRYEALQENGVALQMLQERSEIASIAFGGIGTYAPKAAEIISAVTDESFIKVAGKVLSVKYFRGEDGQVLFEYWQRGSLSAYAQSWLGKLGTAFSFLNVTHTLSTAVARTLFIDALIAKPSAQMRLDDFNSFVNDIPAASKDPAMLDALADFNGQFQELENNYSAWLGEVLGVSSVLASHCR